MTVKILEPLKPLGLPKISKLGPTPVEPIPAYPLGQSPFPSSLSSSSTPQPVVIVPKCAEGHNSARPTTGERIEADEGTSGQSILEITNGLSADAAARLLDNSTN